MTVKGTTLSIVCYQSSQVISKITVLSPLKLQFPVPQIPEGIGRVVPDVEMLRADGFDIFCFVSTQIEYLWAISHLYNAEHFLDTSPSPSYSARSSYYTRPCSPWTTRSASSSQPRSDCMHAQYRLSQQ